MCLFRLHRWCKQLSAFTTYEDGIDNVPKRRNVKFRRRGITQKKEYNDISFTSLFSRVQAIGLEALRYKPEVRGFDSRWRHWIFSLTQSFRPHFGPWVDSASDRNEYQECFLRVKAAGTWGLQPCHLHVPVVLKSGGPKLLEPSGPVQAFNGIALPLPFTSFRTYST
jgi:hypothetical protein